MGLSRAAALDARYQLADASVVRASDSTVQKRGDQERQAEEENVGEPWWEAR
jgi:hypothetical protein